jgi:enolase
MHDLFSKGVYEALELRDGGSDYLGKGVLKVFDYFYVFRSNFELFDVNNLLLSLN